MVLGGLRRCEVLGLRLGDLRLGERRVFIAEGKGGHQRLVPISGRFFTAVAAYLDGERPAGAGTNRLFLVLKGPRRGQPLTADGLDEVLDGARERAGLAHATCHELRHTCLTRLREAGMALEAVQAQAGHVSIESTRIYLHLADDWLASQYPDRGRGHRRPDARRPSTIRPRHQRAALAHVAPIRSTLVAHGADVVGVVIAIGQGDWVLPRIVQVAVVAARRCAGWCPVSGHALLPTWDRMAASLPLVVATMRRYLEQIACVLRPGSVGGTDLALRSFTAFLAEQAPEVQTVADVRRRHVEAFKPWLAARPGMLVGVTVEVLLRTGLRVGEYTSLPADALVLIGGAPWLHVPVGKLHEDRYLPLHPHVVTLIQTYRAAHVSEENPLLLPRENGRPLDRHTVTRMINRAGAAAGLPHIHPHQLRHTLATQAINRGMSLEAIAALLGHRSLDMTLRQRRSPTGPCPRSTSPSPTKSTPST
jgi:site-specific recombinase XerD